MTQYNIVNALRSNSQLVKIKLPKNNTEVTLMRSVKMIGTDEYCFPQKLKLHIFGVNR